MILEHKHYILADHKFIKLNISVPHFALSKCFNQVPCILKLINSFLAHLCMYQVPGQRVLALQLLASIFTRALYSLQGTNDRCTLGSNDKLVDWQAVWAFALGPEPEIALALR